MGLLGDQQVARRQGYYYDRQRAGGRSHHQALRALSNRLVGILHGCIRRRRLYSEEIGWVSFDTYYFPIP